MSEPKCKTCRFYRPGYWEDIKCVTGYCRVYYSLPVRTDEDRTCDKHEEKADE